MTFAKKNKYDFAIFYCKSCPLLETCDTINERNFVSSHCWDKGSIMNLALDALRNNILSNIHNDGNNQV
jgi:hypothetical protein